MPPEIVKMFEQQDRRDAEERRQEFWRLADDIATGWPTLRTTGDAIETVRNKWIAHFELVRQDDPATGFQLVEFKAGTHREVYQQVSDSIEIITKLVEHLASVLTVTDISAHEYRLLTISDAANFWKLKSAK